MKKWCETSWCCLVMVLVVQMAGCAAPQWMSRKGSRGKDDRKVADIDQRESAKSAKKKEKPKVISEKKKESSVGSEQLAADKSKAKPKADEAITAAESKAKRKSDETIAATERKGRSSIYADAEDFSSKPKRKSDDVLAAADRKPMRASSSVDADEDDFVPKKRKAVEKVAAVDEKAVEPKKSRVKKPPVAEEQDELVASRKPAKRSWADAEETAEVREVSHEENDAGTPEWAQEDQPVAKAGRAKTKRTASLDQGVNDDELTDDPFAFKKDIPKKKPAPAAETVAADDEWPSKETKVQKTAKSAKKQSIRKEASVEETDETDPLLAKKLTDLKPSQASYVNHCPNAKGEVRELVSSLDDKNLEHVKRSIHRLGRIGPDAVAALPALEQLQQHSDGYVRVHAALAVCRVDSITPEAMDTLTSCLKSSDSGLRSFSAAVIAELGPQKGETLEVLAEMLDDRDAYVRLHVAEVLIRYDEWSEQSLKTLLGCLKHRDENIRWLTAYSLAELAPQTPDAVDGLAKCLEDESVKVQIGAAYALGEIGPLSRAAMKDLRKHQKDANPELRAAVVYALEQIEGGPAPEVKQSARR